MGAEPWSNFTPYQPDISKAMQYLQEEIFARGEFKRPYIDIDLLDDMGVFKATESEWAEKILKYGFSALRDPIERVGIAGLRQWLIDLDVSPQIATWEELRVLNFYSVDGSRSILDMRRIVPDPQSSCISPIPPEEVLRTYGTEYPTREMVEENIECFFTIPVVMEST